MLLVQLLNEDLVELFPGVLFGQRKVIAVRLADALLLRTVYVAAAQRAPPVIELLFEAVSQKVAHTAGVVVVVHVRSADRAHVRIVLVGEAVQAELTAAAGRIVRRVRLLLRPACDRRIARLAAALIELVNQLALRRSALVG